MEYFVLTHPITGGKYPVKVKSLFTLEHYLDDWCYLNKPSFKWYEFNIVPI